MRLIDISKLKKIEIEHEGYDYVRGCMEGYNTCIEDLETVPEVKAIPIEWIKKQKVDFQNEDYPFNYTRGVQDGYNDCIDYLIDEWEEENGKSGNSD